MGFSDSKTKRRLFGGNEDLQLTLEGQPLAFLLLAAALCECMARHHEQSMEL